MQEKRGEAVLADKGHQRTKVTTVLGAKWRQKARWQKKLKMSFKSPDSRKVRDPSVQRRGHIF